MIESKKDFLKWIKQDEKNNFYTKFSLVKKYLITLRKAEYHHNLNHKIRFLYWHMKHHLLSNKYLTFIPLNVFGPGLSIAHLGCIYISDSSTGGKNVRLSQNVTIGATNGNNKSPAIGNDCFIGPNTCIIGDIKIADSVCIAAGCVVIKDISEDGTTWGGVPAKLISHNDSHSNLPFYNRHNE